MIEKVRIAKENFGNAPQSVFTKNYRIDLTTISRITFDNQYLTNDRHKHNVFELCICLDGEGEFVCDDVSYNISKSCIFIGPPNIPHKISVEKNGNLELLFFRFTIVKIGKKENSNEDVIIQNFLENYNIISQNSDKLLLYSYIFKNYDIKNEGYNAIVKALVLDCLYALSQNKSQKTDKDKIETYIQNNLHGKLNVQDIASFFSMSERSFYYFFKENFDTTPIDYINTQRMLISVNYLKMGMSVKDVSDMLSFSESSAFCRMFKKYYGITPSQYAKSIIT